MCRLINADLREISIKDACLQHFKDIGHNPDDHSTIYENVQARERTQLLMDIANKELGLVIGTGDLSEIALGWSTYNGDHMSMYAVNCSVPKTLVRYLIQWVADNSDDELKHTLEDIINTPISPELVSNKKDAKINQVTEDIIGPYELHDFFLYHIVKYGAAPDKVAFLTEKAFDGKYDTATITKWLALFLRRFFEQQFKRSCIPDGPKVGTISLSPRGDWRMPSDAVVQAWLDKLEHES
jgi:NAD+ synthase (glutamine-hydrolysing)